MRRSELDLIRIIATIMVIVLHCCSSGIAKIICSCCVILFVMISGSLQLDQKKIIEANKIVKMVIRIAVAFIGWSLAYTLAFAEYNTPRDFTRNFIVGPFHLWFCYMIVGLYLVTPIIRQIMQNEKIYRYYLVLCIISAVGFGTIETISALVGISTVFNMLFLKIGLGYTVYYLIGHELVERKITIAMRIGFYVLGLISIVIYSFRSETAGDMDLCEMLYSIAVFLLLFNLGKHIDSIKTRKIMAFIADNCFTVYLVHLLIIYLVRDVFGKIKFTNEFLVVVVNVILSFVVAVILNCIFSYIRGILHESSYFSRR